MRRRLSPVSVRVVVTPSFAAHAARVWGAQGRDWAARIPELVEALSRRWALQPEAADYTLSYNFVVPVAREDGERAVLKLGLPHELGREIEALTIFAGRGACRVLESDRERGALLLERVQPGVPLLELGEQPASVSAAVHVILQLHRVPPAGHGLPRLVDWWRSATDGLESIRGGHSPIPADLVEEADAIYQEIRERQSPEILLHSDLHHWNILSSDRDGWLAIDPHGVTGPPECEIGAFMLNPNNGALVRPDAEVVLRSRLNQFARELQYDRESLRRAALAYAVLSATWSAEDGSDRWRPAIEIARHLRSC